MVKRSDTSTQRRIQHTGTGYGPDDLKAKKTDCAILTVTTACNLRCLYCPVSLPDYSAKTASLEDVRRIALAIGSTRPRYLQLNGHGETTAVPGWADLFSELMDRGIPISITSNFSRAFNAHEISVLARCAYIVISIDTVDAELLAKIRRKVQLSVLLDNLDRVVAAVRSAGTRRKPIIHWQCTVSDKTIWGLREFVKVGIAHGVNQFNFGSLVEHSDSLQLFGVDAPRHPSKLPVGDLPRAYQVLVEVEKLLAANKRSYFFQHGIRESISAALQAAGLPAPAVAVRAEFYGE